MGPIIGGVLVGILLAGVVLGGYLLGRESAGDDQSSADTPPPTDTASEAQAPQEQESPKRAKKTPRPKKSGPGDVRDLDAGLFCRDLNAQAYSYSAAVDYWRMHGQPDQMDADQNGIPCETVYPAQRVRAYWGDRMPAPDAPVYEPPRDGSYLDLASGLFCRDLYASGYSYGDAVSYWYHWNMPDRMDADLNGIPCETVYPKSTVDLYW